MLDPTADGNGSGIAGTPSPGAWRRSPPEPPPEPPEPAPKPNLKEFLARSAQAAAAREHKLQQKREAQRLEEERELTFRPKLSARAQRLGRAGEPAQEAAVDAAVVAVVAERHEAQAKAADRLSRQPPKGPAPRPTRRAKPSAPVAPASSARRTVAPKPIGKESSRPDGKAAPARVCARRRREQLRP